MLDMRSIKEKRNKVCDWRHILVEYEKTIALQRRLLCWQSDCRYCPAWPNLGQAVVFSAGGDGGRRSPEHLAELRFWLAAYVVLGLLLAIFGQSLGNWLLSYADFALADAL